MVSSYLSHDQSGFCSSTFFFFGKLRFGKLYHVTQPIPACDVSRGLKTSPEEANKILTCCHNSLETIFFFFVLLTGCKSNDDND